MGEGLKRVARLCGGITVRSRGVIVEYDEAGEVILACPKGGTCRWGIDGMHGNRYCKKCYIPHPSEVSEGR